MDMRGKHETYIEALDRRHDLTSSLRPIIMHFSEKWVWLEL